MPWGDDYCMNVALHASHAHTVLALQVVTKWIVLYC